MAKRTKGNKGMSKPKSRIGHLLMRGLDAKARDEILAAARGGAGAQFIPAAITPVQVASRLGIHRMTMWRYVKRLDLYAELEAIYTQALADSDPPPLVVVEAG